MKKIAFIAFATAIMFAGCKKADSFSLSSSTLPEDMNGKYIYIYNEVGNKLLDSVLVENKSFKYESAVDTNSMYRLVVGEDMYPFVKEPKALSLVKKENASPDEQAYTITGSDLTARYYELSKEIQALYAPFRAEAEAVMNNEELDDQAKSEKIDILNKTAISQQNEIARKYYEQNKENAIGAYAFGNINFATDEEFITEYENTPQAIQNNETISKRYNVAKNSIATQAGSEYKDFTMKDENGNEKKLSEYVGNDKYLLVDFWASWCGPCRRSIPHLADLDKQYAAKGLHLLSIGTWDKPEDNAKAIRELNMTWDTILDSENAGADAYGIAGIPTMILISPEGQILVRTHNPEEVTAKLQEIFK